MASVAIISSMKKPAAAGFPLRQQIESSLGEHLSSTLLLRERDAPGMAPIGVAALDALTGGLPRGALSEIAGPTSSGRTSVMLRALAAAIRRQEVCALVDASNSFDPASAIMAGVNLEQLLWVRCNCPTRDTKSQSRKEGLRAHTGFAYSGALEQVLKVTDLLLQSGGFGMVVLDLGDVPADSARRVPLTSWFRFRRAVEPTATVLLVIEQESCARTCASLVLQLQPETILTSYSAGECQFEQIRFVAEGVAHASLLRGMRCHAEVARSWIRRKAPQSCGAEFELRTAL